MKILPEGAELFNADGEKDGQTDMTKLIAAIRNFAKPPESEPVIFVQGNDRCVSRRIQKRKMPFVDRR
jgi:hypothetical protein